MGSSLSPYVARLSSCSVKCRKEEPGSGPLHHWFVVPVTAVDLEDLAGKTLARILVVRNLQVFAARDLPGSRICTGCVPQGSLSNSSVLPR